MYKKALTLQNHEEDKEKQVIERYWMPHDKKEPYERYPILCKMSMVQSIRYKGTDSPP